MSDKKDHENIRKYARDNDKRISELEEENKTLNNQDYDNSKRISELEKIIGQKSWYKKDIGSIIDILEKEIAELRDRVDRHMKNQTHFRKQLSELKDHIIKINGDDSLYQHLLIIKEVLRELINALMITEYAISRSYGRELLAKLDGVGSARQTEKKELCKDCPGHPYNNCEPCPLEASGGEKEHSQQTEHPSVNAISVAHSDSKPPEPIKEPHIYGHPKKEPRENDYILSADGYCVNPKKLISEFVEDLYNNDLTIGDLQKKWEDKLK